jgi:hypothetical protein
MKTLRNFFALFVMGALVLASCEKKNEGGPAVDPAPAPGEDEPEVVFPDIMPVIDAPGAGNITIAVYAPSNTCGGIIIAGNFNNYTPSDVTYAFTKLEGEDRWWTITLPYAADFDGKVIALTQDGKGSWDTQWGLNSPEDELENVVKLAGECTFVGDLNPKEVKVQSIPDGTVVFIGIKEWKTAPCAERNKAGKATFTLTAAALPEGETGRKGALVLDVDGYKVSIPVVQGEVKDPATSVENVESVLNGKIFNLLGVEVDENYKGIVIKNGQKTIQ